MFSGLPKLFDKQFVIGFLIPVVVFALAVDVLLRSRSDATALATAMWEEKQIGALAVTVAALWFSAMLLMLTNRLVHRMFSGYWWPFNDWWGKRRLEARRADLVMRIACDAARLGNATSAESDPLANELRDHNRRLYQFRRSFPREDGQVLGTRFGNVIRITDRYANRVYGVDGVIIWPRLNGVISKELLTQIGDLRAQVDCFINLAMLALIFAVTAVTTGVVGILLFPHPSMADYLRPVAGTAALGIWWVAYELAIERAVAMGEQTRAAYDLYLPKLVQALGYNMPAQRAEQTALLTQIATTFMYFKPIDRPWDSAPAPSALADQQPDTTQHGDDD